MTVIPSETIKMRQPIRFLALALLWMACGSYPCLAQQEPSGQTLEDLLKAGPAAPVDKEPAKPRMPVPDEASIKEARKLIKEVYADDYRTAAEDPGPFIQKLLLAVIETDDAARKYAMLLEAEQVAIAGRDPTRAIEVVDLRADAFGVDGMGCRIETLATFLSPKAYTDAALMASLSDSALSSARECIEAGELKHAKAAAEIAATAAKKLLLVRKGPKRDESLVGANQQKQAQVRDLLKEITRRMDAAAAYNAALETLRANPEDLAAKDVVGRHLCLMLSDWKGGLPWLAKGSQKDLAEAAAIEMKTLAAPEPEMQAIFALAGQWWGIAESRGYSEEEIVGLKRHAGLLYAAVSAKLVDPLDSALAQRRLAEMSRQHGVDGAERATATRHGPSVNSIGIKMVLIPRGTFIMGEGSEAHEVTLTKPFFIGAYEVTNAQWKAVMGSMPSKWKDDDRPVEQVSWDDAMEFCRKLSELPEEKKAGRVYRLPTEAEWEYACRAGTKTGYSFGDDESLLGDYGWFNKNSDEQTHPVGKKKPNAAALYDTHGNVIEWCSDWNGDYPKGAVTDPQGPSSGSTRVGRGGSWRLTAGSCRSAHLYWINPSIRNNFLGFRLALSPSEAK